MDIVNSVGFGSTNANKDGKQMNKIRQTLKKIK